MFNHARGLWGYTGIAADGEPLTIQATGLGAASAALVCAELLSLGLRTFVRLGTARALEGGPGAGDAVAVTRAIAADGPSRALGAGDTVSPDAGLTSALIRAAGASTIVATADLARPDAGSLATWTGAGARLCDLQTATVLQVAHTARVPAAAILVVTGAVSDPAGVDAEIADDALLTAVTRAAHAAATALGLPPRTTPPLPPPRDDERVAA